jgi:cytochrome c
MKKSLLAAGSALFLFGLAGCGGGDKPADPAPAAAPVASAPEPSAPVEATAEVAPVEAASEATPAPAATADEDDTAALLAALPAPYNTADLAKGRRLFAQCKSCHLVEAGAGHRVGPNLHDIFGRQIATGEGFAYSKALTAETFVWTPELVDHWLENPRTFVKGNRMSFAGFAKEEDRNNVIAYLMIESTR